MRTERDCHKNLRFCLYVQSWGLKKEICFVVEEKEDEFDSVIFVWTLTDFDTCKRAWFVKDLLKLPCSFHSSFPLQFSYFTNFSSLFSFFLFASFIMFLSWLCPIFNLTLFQFCLFLSLQIKHTKLSYEWMNESPFIHLCSQFSE